MALALNNLKRVDIPLNKETKPNLYIYILLTNKILLCLLKLYNTPTAPIQEGKTPPPTLNEATFWPWKATCKTWGWDPGAWAIVVWQPEWSHNLQHSTLTITGLDRWSAMPGLINQLVISILSTYMIVLIDSSNFSCGKQTPNPFCLKGVWRRWLRLSWIWNHLKLCTNK